MKVDEDPSCSLPLPIFDPPELVLRMEVKDVIPHFPTVPADLAADGRLLFSLKSLSNCILVVHTFPTLRPKDFE